MSDRVLHLLEDLLTCVVVLLIAAYVCMEWAAAAPEPTKAELVAAYYAEGMRAQDSGLRAQGSERAAEASAPTEERVYLGRWYVTGYDVCASCCGKTDGITASGTTATVGRTCAVNGLAFGTRLFIDGLGERIVEDRGGMRAEHVDVLCADHPACYAVTGWYEVYKIGG